MPRAVLLGCFFLTGAAGLVAEIAWIRRASLAFGSTIHAVSLVLAVFFLGIALGSAWFGARAARIARPLRAYALIEFALAVLVLATVPLFAAAESVYAVLYRAVAQPGPGVRLALAGLVALVLLPPAVLMGGTLPVLCRHVVHSPRRIGAAVGMLYSVNTLGAVAGCLLCGLVLLPRLGLRASLCTAAALDLVAALAALWLTRVSDAPAPAPATARAPAAPETPRIPPLLLVLFFGIGFVAIGNEVLWTRFLALAVRTTILTYTVALAVVLAGIVLGSAVVAAVVDRMRARAAWFGALQVLGGLVSVTLAHLPPGVWRGAGETGVYALLLLPPAVLSGAALPLGIRIAVDRPEFAAAGVGRLVAWNTLGGIAGSLVVGFLLLPHWGLHASVLVTTGCAMAGGFATWAFLCGTRAVPLRVAAAGACAALWLLLPRALGTRLPQDFLAERGRLIAFREGLESNLAVIDRNGIKQLEADRWWQGQDRATHQVLAAHVPLLLHPHPRRVLVVGVGAGQTPARVLDHDVERLDCVDIEPAVFDVVRAHFASAWMQDPRVRLVPEDGRSWIGHGAERYDVIALEAGQIFRPGVAGFYTVDFYRQARARLLPGGMVSQFVPLPFLTSELFRDVVATFHDVFPQSVLWYNTAELLLIGFASDRVEVPLQRLEILRTNPRLHASLGYSHWDGPAHALHHPHVFLAGFLSGPEGVAALAAGGRIERDDRPVLPYATRFANERMTNELAILPRLRAHLDPIGRLGPEIAADRTLVAAAVAVREQNLGDVEAAALLRRVEDVKNDATALAALLARARAANPANVQVQRLSGDAALLRGRAAEAEQHYAHAVELEPGDAVSRLGLGRSLHVQRRFAEAITHYRAGLVLRPDDAEAHNNLAAALAESGDLDGAERHFEAALRLRPDYEDARANLSRLRAARRR